MSEKTPSSYGRGVSIEMTRQKNVKNLLVSKEGKGQVLFEGNLGKKLELSMDDDSVLEVKGGNGILRVDLSLKEIEDMIKKIRSKKTSGSKD